MFRTLYKQGPYGRKPLVKRVLIITPGSLVKVCYGSVQFVHVVSM